MSLVVDEHRQYLDDRARVAAFDRALTAVISPGDVVVDLASGTGILGLLACRAGASRVYAIESESIGALARPFARDNSLDDRIVVVHELASRVTLPERADVIVTDLAGRFGFEAGLIEVLGDARRRFLKPGGRLIPSSVTLHIAPVEAAEMRREIDFWTQPVSGLSFRAAHPLAQCTGYPRHLDVSDLLADGQPLTTVDLHHDCDAMSGRVEFAVAREGRLDAIGGWFSAALAPDVALTNAPGAAGRINRRNVLFPLRSTVDVRTGDRVAVSMIIRPADLLVRWRVAISRNGRVEHETDASTLGGMLVSPEGLRRLRPAGTPVLTEAGRARRTVLELCDGVRSLADIERAVFDRHSSLFPSRDNAVVFVAEVLARYAV
jgi:protein arginine N-methyltransferase 1